MSSDDDSSSSSGWEIDPILEKKKKKKVIIVDDDDSSSDDKPKPKKKKDEIGQQGMYWMFTWFELDKKPEVILHSKPWRFISYQLEICPKTGKYHWQGYICFKTNQRFNSLKKLLTSVHWELRMGDHEQALDYVTKDDTRCPLDDHPEICHSFTDGDEKSIPRMKGDRMDLRSFTSAITSGETDIDLITSHPIEFLKYSKQAEKMRSVIQDDTNSKIPSRFTNMNFLPWQEKIWNLLRKQNYREILWVVDIQGGKGKSTFGKILQKKHGAFLVTSASEKHVSFAYKSEKIIVFDLTRESSLKMNYTMLEHFKDGNVFVDMYEAKNKYVPEDVKVLVLANFEPEKDKLSSDRWVIERLDEDDQQVRGFRRQKPPPIETSFVSGRSIVDRLVEDMDTLLARESHVKVMDDLHTDLEEEDKHVIDRQAQIDKDVLNYVTDSEDEAEIQRQVDDFWDTVNKENK